MTKTKRKLVLKVSHRNIRKRYEAEKKLNPDFTLVDMAIKFGALDKKGKPIKAIVWRWMDETYKRLPNKAYKCPCCGKSQYDLVSAWINESILQ